MASSGRRRLGPLRVGLEPRVAALALFLCSQGAPTPASTTETFGGAALVVEAAAGDIPSVQGWKTGGVWTLRVRDPSGTLAASVVWREPAVTTVSFVAQRDGPYTFACEPAADTEAGCELEVIGRGPEPTNRSARIGVEASLRKGHELLWEWSRPTTTQAEQLFRGALAESRARGLLELEIDSLLGLAEACLLAGAGPAALTFLETAVGRAQELGDRRRLAWASTRLGSSLATLGQEGRAEAHLDRAMGVAQETGFLLGAAQAHLGRGDVRYFRSELTEARNEYQSAIEAFSRLGNTEGLLEAHLGAGYALADLSQDARARSHFERALALARAGGDRRREAVALRLLGNVHAKLTDERESIRCFEAARALFEQADDRVALVGLYNGFGEVHGHLGDVAAALQYHQKAESLARATGFRAAEGTALLEIAKHQRSLGRLPDAASSYEKAKALFESIGDTAMAASALAGLGNVAAAEGRLEAAIQHLEAALGIMRRVGEAGLAAGMLNDLAEAQLSQGRIAPAQETAREGLRLAREATDALREARSLYILARGARGSGALDEAKDLAERALEVGEGVRARIPGHELRALFFEELGSRYAFYVDLLMEMERARPEAPFERLAFLASERGRARVLLDRLREERAASRTDEKARARERALQEEIRAEALREDLGTPQEQGQGETRLREMLAEARRVQGLGESDAAGPGESRPLQPVPLEQIQAKLAEAGTLLIELCLGAERSYLWTLDRERLAVHVLPSREVLESQAREVYGLLTARQDDAGGSARERRLRGEAQDARFQAAGATLAETVLGPIENLDAFSRLIIVSDGVLNYVPFAALPHPQARAGGGGAYLPLVLSHEIVRAPSLSAMVAMQERPRPLGPHDGRGVAVLADPVFGTDDPRLGAKGPKARTAAGAGRARSARQAGGSATNLPRLLASREEASAIKRAAAGQDVTITTDFEVDRQKAEESLSSSYGVVHFATHGILNEEHPALSAIVTSLIDENGLPRDGFLRAQDVYGLRVASPLVVLSACETALGRLLRGEGITGLVHAFLHAGASTVVASKWRVDDVATQELMAAFYRHLLTEGMEAPAALRAAQIELFRRPRTRAAFYWGAFEVHGLSRGFSPSSDRP